MLCLVRARLGRSQRRTETTSGLHEARCGDQPCVRSSEADIPDGRFPTRPSGRRRPADSRGCSAKARREIEVLSARVRRQRGWSRPAACRSARLHLAVRRSLAGRLYQTICPSRRARASILDPLGNGARRVAPLLLAIRSGGGSSRTRLRFAGVGHVVAVGVVVGDVIAGVDGECSGRGPIGGVDRSEVLGHNVEDGVRWVATKTKRSRLSPLCTNRPSGRVRW